MLSKGTSLTTDLKYLDSSLSSNASLYSPLDQGRSEFRLLDVFPGEQRAPLRCSLRVEPFRTWDQGRSQWMMKNYETISYCWGDHSIRESIMVNDINISVPKSSAAALRCMRLETKPRTLWIDAICIDQSNIDERGHQVRMMQQIYTNGLVNLIHLGTTDMQEASDSIDAIRDDEQASNMIEETRTDGKSEYNFVKAAYNVDALVSLFEHDWFKRVWVVQEAVLAKQNQVHSGTTVIDLLDITRAATTLWYNRNFVDVRILEHLNPVHGLNELVDPVHGFKGRHSTVDPSYIAFMLRCHDATEPVDKIYAMLGLYPTAKIIPDYSKEPAKVYLEAARWMIQATNSLGVLRLAQEASPTFSKIDDGCSRPSWTPDFGAQDDQGRGSYDLCFGFNSTGDRTFGASENVEWRDNPNSRILPARGVRLGSVCSGLCSGGQHIGRIPEMMTDWLTRMDYEPPPGCSLETIIAMTLCAGATCSEALVETSDAILGLKAQQELYRRNIDPPTFTERHQRFCDSGKAVGATQQAAGTYEEALWSALAARHLFLTSNNFCGLGPQFMRLGDVAVILYGLRWPAILRPVGSLWHFVGLAYIHGAMNGEIVAQQEGAGGQVDEVFEIV